MGISLSHYAAMHEFAYGKEFPVTSSSGRVLYSSSYDGTF